MVRLEKREPLQSDRATTEQDALKAPVSDRKGKTKGIDLPRERAAIRADFDRRAKAAAERSRATDTGIGLHSEKIRSYGKTGSQNIELMLLNSKFHRLLQPNMESPRNPFFIVLTDSFRHELQEIRVK